MARTKKQPSKGLGDTIEKITEATGIKKAVEIFAKATGIDCGCEERKTKLNNLIPYRRKVNCLNESDYNQLTEFLKPNKGSLTPNEQWTIAAIYERVFEIKLQHSNCASCWRDTLSDLRKVHNEYKVND
jgi:DNA polymerase III alpha subunit